MDRSIDALEALLACDGSTSEDRRNRIRVALAPLQSDLQNVQTEMEKAQENLQKVTTTLWQTRIRESLHFFQCKKYRKSLRSLL